MGVAKQYVFHNAHVLQPGMVLGKSLQSYLLKRAGDPQVDPLPKVVLTSWRGRPDLIAGSPQRLLGAKNFKTCH